MGPPGIIKRPERRPPSRTSGNRDWALAIAFVPLSANWSRGLEERSGQAPPLPASSTASYTPSPRRGNAGSRRHGSRSSLTTGDDVLRSGLQLHKGGRAANTVHRGPGSGKELLGTADAIGVNHAILRRPATWRPFMRRGGEVSAILPDRSQRAVTAAPAERYDTDAQLVSFIFA